MISVQLTQQEAEALDHLLIAVDDATHPNRIAFDGEPFDGAPTGRRRAAVRRAWWKIAKALGSA